MHTCNSSTQEPEERRLLWVQEQPEIHSEDIDIDIDDIDQKTEY